MKAKKLITLLLCAALLVTCTVMGTLAYLQDTATVTNTFTVGNVEITLDEYETDLYGAPNTGNPRVTENTYKLIPGHTYTKDPKITVKADSENCYVFVKVENGIAGALPTNCIEDQMSGKGWTYSGAKGVWYKATAIPASTTDTEISVFDNFTVENDITGVQLSGFSGKTIEITAYAVQADGFTDALDAWDHTYGAP